MLSFIIQEDGLCTLLLAIISAVSKAALSKPEASAALELESKLLHLGSSICAQVSHTPKLCLFFLD